ncbi:hypothetical protein B7494_g7395 [Chlorociboria aeruginascens]|nr:hypothetical protein B7494_g7395 [Chlorociboria aeruginascens]
MASPPSYTSIPQPSRRLSEMPTSAPSINRRKASMISTTSATSAHPLRQTSFPPEQVPRYSASPSVDGSLLSGGPSNSTKKKRSRKSKGAAGDEGSVKGVPARSAISGNSGKSGAKKRKRAESVDEEEEDGGEGEMNVEMVVNTQEEKQKEIRHRAMLVNAFDEEQFSRYEAWRSSKLPDSIVRRIVNQTLSQSAPASVILAVKSVAKIFAGEMIEGARKVQSEWIAVANETQTGLPSPPAEPSIETPDQTGNGNIEGGRKEREKETRRGPLGPDHLREAIRRYKVAREGDLAGQLGLWQLQQSSGVERFGLSGPHQPKSINASPHVSFSTSITITINHHEPPAVDCYLRSHSQSSEAVHNPARLPPCDSRATKLAASILPATPYDNSYSLINGSDLASPSPTGKDDTLARAKHLVQRYVFFLIPSPIQRRLRPAQFKPQRLYPTSYLDGLRGVASLLVFFCHFTEGHLGWYINSYGVLGADTVPSSPLQLPFLRVLYSGRPMVHVFFVISGFVLSHKPLKLVRAHNYSALQATLASSVFRRTLRLFLPTTASTFLILVLVQLGWMGRPQPTLGAQFIDWFKALYHITYSWNWDITQIVPYDSHLWTIPIEMSNSMLLFITITGLSHCKVWIRLFLVLGIMFYCLKCQHWASFEFLGGMFVAEVGLIQIARAERDANKESASTSDMNPTASKPVQVFWFINLIIALFLIGWPNVGVEHTPGLRHLAPITMDPFFTTGGDLVSFPWFALAAMQTVIACQQIPFLQDLFTSPPAQYLASISYAMYLMHGPMLDTFGPRFMPILFGIVGGAQETGMWGRLFVWFTGLIAIGIPTFWASDVFWRLVDTPSVAFAKWLEEICVVKED